MSGWHTKTIYAGAVFPTTRLSSPSFSPCSLYESLPVRLTALAVGSSSLCEEPCGRPPHLVGSSLVQKQVHHFIWHEMGGPVGQKRRPRLNKDEVGSIFARAAVVHIHPGPPPVAARGDHVLKPGRHKNVA